MPTEFHARSAFSFLRGANPPEVMVMQAALAGYRAIAITDHDGFHGSARAHHAARECGIHAIVGTTWTLPDGSHLPILCPDAAAYRSLSRGITDRHLLDQGIPADPHGWIVLTGDREGPLCRPLLRGDRPAALTAARQLIDTFGQGNVYVEIFRHGLREDKRLVRELADLAAHLRLPLLASNAPIHATRADRLLADAFTCLRQHIPLDEAGLHLLPNGERHLRPAKEMQSLFADFPAALREQERLLDRIGFSLENLGYRFPDFPDGMGHPLSLPEQSTLLRRLTFAGAARRYGPLTRAVKDQLTRELAMIHQLGFSGYFLIVHDLVDFACGEGILCQGRGSAANSAVCYALGITNVDPVGGGLLFERFLSENRRSWPDIDIDFPSGERREKVIQHVFRKYGPRGAAMTANVITYRPRSAFREMSKVLGFPATLADRFSTEHAGWRGGDDEETDARRSFEDRLCTLIPPSHPRLPALTKLYHAVLGLPRHLGQHSGGMIVCDRGLDAVVPLQPATMPGRTVVQWDKDDCEDLGIVKIDLLGLGMLAAMEDALRICEIRGHPVDLARIPKDDPAVYDLLGRAETIGTFQVESRAQMATLPIMRPKCFYDLAIQVAIIRPGPIVGDLVHPYLNRRNGHEEIDYIHPLCQPILERTLGVPLFQEQVLRMAMEVAGFSGAEADELRRAMAFKRSDERMEKVSTKLRERMSARHIPHEVQEKIVHSIGSFALYGFPESHSISFALIAYASCWLKVHRGAEFFAGLINHQPMGFYSVHTLIQDAKRRGLRILAPSVCESDMETRVIDDSTLRLGLHRIKGLSTATGRRIIDERDRAPFLDLPDFLRRCTPSAAERRLLAKSGALNPLPAVAHRRDALWQAELPLFDDLLSMTRASCSSPSRERPATGSPSNSLLPPMTPVERLTADFETQGASIGPHPMALWRAASPLRLARARDLHDHPHGTRIEIGGMVICRQRPGTAKGHCFISLEDETGIANLFVPKKTYDLLRRVIVTENFLLGRGFVQRTEGDQPTVYITDIQPLPATETPPAAPAHNFH